MGKQNLDVSTAALALCLVDDAVQQGLLRDDTTALGCACCFLLAAKFNEMLTPQAVKSIRDVCAQLSHLRTPSCLCHHCCCALPQRLAKELKVSASDITSHEFLFAIPPTTTLTLWTLCITAHSHNQVLQQAAVLAVPRTLRARRVPRPCPAQAACTRPSAHRAVPHARPAAALTPHPCHIRLVFPSPPHHPSPPPPFHTHLHTQRHQTSTKTTRGEGRTE